MRKVCAIFGVILRTGMDSSAGEGPLTCGKGITVALCCLSPCTRGFSGAAQIRGSEETHAPSDFVLLPRVDQTNLDY